MVSGVTKRYELTATHDVVEDIIISNVSDPLTGQEARTSTSHWIFDRKPDISKVGVPAPKGYKYPIIVISYPDSDMECRTVNGDIMSVSHIIAVECYSRTVEQANQLAEEICYILTVTGNSELLKAALHGPININPVSGKEWLGGDLEFMKGFEFTFRRMD